MKKLLSLAAMLLVGIGLYSEGAAARASQSEETDSTEIVARGIWNELKTIREMQRNNYIRRNAAVEARCAHDSLCSFDHSCHDITTDYGMMSSIEENTRPDKIKDGWNLYGWIAFVVAFVSLAVACVSALIGYWTWKAQKSTEQHTQKAPLEAQMGMLRDIPRHFYRNLVCTCAALLKFRHKSNIGDDGRRNKYPSEANVLKLTTLPDEYILPIDSVDTKVYKEMHEEKLLFKNYNLEVESAAKHFANSRISDDSLKGDYDNLLFKPLFLIAKMYRLQDAITKSDKSYRLENNVPYSLFSFVLEHFDKQKISILVCNKNDEMLYLSEIMEGSAFNKAVGGCGVGRGFDWLMSSDDKNGGRVSFMQYTKDDNGVYDKNAAIDKNEFVSYFRKKSKDEGKTEAMGQFDKALNTTDGITFAENYGIGDLQKAHELYASMKPYFDFFQQDTWDAKELLFTILKVDIVLELGKIGMIDY